MAGFIGIDRNIEDHWVYQDAEYFKVWFEILLRTRYSIEPEKKLIDGRFVTIEYGQFMYGRISWSERLKVSEQRLRTLFKKLVDDGMIDIVQKFPKFSLYSVKNYAKYNQHSNQQQDQSEQGNSDDANQQTNDTPTSSQPAANQQLTTQEQGSNKGNKVNKENKKIYYAEFVRLTPEEHEKLVSQYGEEMTKECIDILNTYKGSTGKKYTSDYMTMTPSAWVPKRYYEDQEKKFRVVNGGQYRGKPNTMNRLDELYKKAVEEEKEREASGHY